jgi:hypothetical protein
LHAISGHRCILNTFWLQCAIRNWVFEDTSYISSVNLMTLFLTFFIELNVSRFLRVSFPRPSRVNDVPIVFQILWRRSCHSGKLVLNLRRVAVASSDVQTSRLRQRLVQVQLRPHAHCRARRSTSSIHLLLFFLTFGWSKHKIIWLEGLHILISSDTRTT